MAKELAEAFGAVIREHRVRKGWSQMKLAQEAGLHLNALGNLERGQRSPSLHTVFTIARALEVPPGKLVAAVQQLTEA